MAITRPMMEDPGDLSGQVLDDRYRLVEPLKRGAMGTVYIAEQVRLGTRVAVKLLHETQEERARERFAREAAALAQLQHPNVARGIDFGWTDTGRLFLVMEYIEGRDLRERLASEGALPWREVCRLGAQIAGALHEAHRAGLVHRDLKPENLMLEKSNDHEDVRVLDFGIAHVKPDALGGDQRPLTLAGDVVGTVGYMAPEQAMGQNVDRRADLYALGVLLWEMLSGERLFGEDPETVLGVQLREEPPRPALTGGAPDALGDLVTQLLASLPDSRPDDADAIATRLGEFPQEKAAAAPNRSLTMGLAAAALLILGGVAWRVTQPVDPPPIANAAPVAETEPAPLVPDELPVKDEPEDEVEFPLESLLEGRREERVAAAHAVLARRDEAPPFAVAVARMELARQCATKERQLRALIRYDDDRALPAVRRANRLSDEGCGLLGRRDCYACLRDTVSTALRRLNH
ncbi:MAG: serine/threonine-protein kinase [Myxococcota bacterium]